MIYKFICFCALRLAVKQQHLQSKYASLTELIIVLALRAFIQAAHKACLFERATLHELNTLKAALTRVEDFLDCDQPPHVL